MQCARVQLSYPYVQDAQRAGGAADYSKLHAEPLYTSHAAKDQGPTHLRTSEAFAAAKHGRHPEAFSAAQTGAFPLGLVRSEGYHLDGPPLEDYRPSARLQQPSNSSQEEEYQLRAFSSRKPTVAFSSR